MQAVTIKGNLFSKLLLTLNNLQYFLLEYEEIIK